MEAGAERAGMFFAQNLRIGVVVEEAEFLAPCDEHGEAGFEQEADHRSQRLWPCRGISERRVGPIVAAHQRADLAAAGHEFKRSVDRVSHRYLAIPTHA